MAESSKAKDKSDSRQRKQAAADLRQRSGRNLVFGAVASIVGAVLTMWSNRGVGDMGMSVTQLIYWLLIGGGALEVAVGVWQLYQAREILAGRMAIPEGLLGELTEPGSRAEDKGPLEISLRPARGKHVGWALIGLLIGFLFLFAVGGGAGVGFGLAAGVWGAYHVYRIALFTFGRRQVVRIDDERAELPRGPVGDKVTSIAPGEIKHAFFLRRSVPLFQASPVLVVEVGDEALTFPRDWFASEGDQERVAAAIRARQS